MALNREDRAHYAYAKVATRQIGEDGLEWPDLPGWTDEELTHFIPGGVVHSAKLPGGWIKFHCGNAPRDWCDAYQEKLAKTPSVIFEEDDLPDESHEVDIQVEDGIDAKGFMKYRTEKQNRTLKQLTARCNYGVAKARPLKVKQVKRGTTRLRTIG